ncbi:hypothetical protein F4780DRAFT_602008 [Xylariomycetidae sp. FL0641]|nr:hypothetical protein F4780DRAFT_602008 [Xylariomycetidae sp. FL0641]
MKGGGVGKKDQIKNKSKTYNTGDSLIVTDSTTDPAVSGLFKAERTGCQIVQILWSHHLESREVGIVRTPLRRLVCCRFRAKPKGCNIDMATLLSSYRPIHDRFLCNTEYRSTV